jgi:hypothetical protein
MARVDLLVGCHIGYLVRVAGNVLVVAEALDLAVVAEAPKNLWSLSGSHHTDLVFASHLELN